MRLLNSNTLLFSALFLGITITKAFSQSFFNNGYIVLLAGDTLKGEIRERSAQVIDFRSASANQVQAYTPEQLTGYQVEGGNRLAVRFTEDGQETAYFMREQVKGHISLYTLFKPEGRLTHAIRLPDKTFVPLRGNLALLMLTKHLTACQEPSFTRLLKSQSSSLGNAQIEFIINRYNACVSPGQSVKRPRKPFHYEAGLSIGIVRNSWKYSGGAGTFFLYWNPNQVYSPNYTVALGGFFTIVPQKRLSASLEGLFTHYKGSRVILISDPLNPTSDASRLYSFSESYVALPLTGRYVFYNGSARWYLKGGIVPTFITSVEGNFSGPNINNADIPIRATLGVGYLAGLGVDIKLGPKRHLLIEARTMPHLVRDHVTTVANSRSLQLMVNVPLIQH